MRIYDISVPLSRATPTYPGDPGIEITNWLTLANGDAANVSLLHFGAHSGTHVDAPAHFIDGGAKVESLLLESLVGRVEVVGVPNSVQFIDETFVVANCSSPCERIIFKTRNSDFWNDPATGFRVDYTYLAPAAAKRLVESGIKLV